MTRLKLKILMGLLKWFHEKYYSDQLRDEDQWWALDTVRGLVYRKNRDSKR